MANWQSRQFLHLCIFLIIVYYFAAKKKYFLNCIIKKSHFLIYFLRNTMNVIALNYNFYIFSSGVAGINKAGYKKDRREKLKIDIMLYK